MYIECHTEITSEVFLIADSLVNFGDDCFLMKMSRKIIIFCVFNFFHHVSKIKILLKYKLNFSLNEKSSPN